jgi:hypothetical protein
MQEPFPLFPGLDEEKRWIPWREASNLTSNDNILCSDNSQMQMLATEAGEKALVYPGMITDEHGSIDCC